MASSSDPLKVDPQDAEAVAEVKNMSIGDVEAIGAHCSDEFCHVKTFLPFTCQHCKKKFCEDHWRPDWHKCRAIKAKKDEKEVKLPGKPTLATHDKQCFSIKCKTLIDTLQQPAVHCDTCRRDYCLKHRMREDHDCDKIPPLLPSQSTFELRKERGISALKNFRAWANKKAEATKPSRISIKSAKPRQPTGLAAINDLKREARGDKTIAHEKRVYLFAEASADTTTAKYPSGKFFYSKEWAIGRLLDYTAKELQVENVNNRVAGEEQRLRVFHIEGGKLLEFGDRVEKVLKTGDTIVLLRGVGPPVPALINV